MNKPSMLAAIEAVLDTERALRRAADTVDDLSNVAASALRVLDDAAVDAFYAHGEERRNLYLRSAGEHLERIRNRSGVMNDLGADLTRHLTTASNAIEQASYELGRSTDENDRGSELQALWTQIDVLGEVVALARPVADQITRHAQHAAESAGATDALMLLDSRVHDTGKEMNRADVGVSVMRSVIEHAQVRAHTSSALAGSLSYAASHPPQPATETQQPGQSGIAI